MRRPKCRSTRIFYFCRKKDEESDANLDEVKNCSLLTSTSVAPLIETSSQLEAANQNTSTYSLRSRHYTSSESSEVSKSNLAQTKSVTNPQPETPTLDDKTASELTCCILTPPSTYSNTEPVMGCVPDIKVSTEASGLPRDPSGDVTAANTCNIDKDTNKSEPLTVNTAKATPVVTPAGKYDCSYHT